MKSTGIVRKIDELGRIVLPIELRRTLSIGERDSLEIFVDDEAIILKKVTAQCVFCGSKGATVLFHGKNVCENCMNGLKQL